MFQDSKAFSGFSVDNIPLAKQFYGEVLGLKVEEDSGMLHIHLGGGGDVLVYPKKDHVPATFTILNFPVEDIHSAVKDLKKRGIEFIHYDDTDEEGITHNEGPLIAWFKDPAGNFLSVIESNPIQPQEVLDADELNLQDI